MDKDIIKDAKEAFKQCEESEADNRETALEDLQFGRMGEQWEEKDKQSRDQDGRPCMTFNKLPAFVRQIVNDARQNKPSIKVHPVDDTADPDTAEILNGVIRNIEVQSRADVAYDTAIDSAVSCGFGYFRVDVEYASDDSFDRDIKINRIANPFTVFGDPTSTEADSSDWNVAFVTEMLKADDFEKQYPDAEKVDFETDFTDEKDRLWFQDKSVRIAEYWTRGEVSKVLLQLSDGQVMLAEDYARHKEDFDQFGITVEGERDVSSHEAVQHIINGQEVLETNEWAGKWIPIIPVYGDEVNVEGKRHFQSLIHFSKDAQRSYNYHRTTAAEVVALQPKAPWIGKAGSFDEDPRWATANSVSHPYLEYDGDVPPQRQPFASVPTGIVNEALAAADDMKAIMGLHDASLGARSNETSGRAILARQREGDVSTFHFLDNMTRAIRHAGSIVVDLIPKVYSQPRVMRIMGEDETPQNVQVNQPIPTGEVGPDGQPVLDEQGQPASRIYDLTAGKYDVTVKAGPNFTTRREEAATQMTELIRSFPDAAPVIGDILAESLDWPKADEIAKRLKSMLPQQVQAEQGNPEADALKQQMQQGLQAFQALQAELEALKAEKSLESRELEIKEFEAKTDRMEAEAKMAQIPVGQAGLPY